MRLFDQELFHLQNKLQRELNESLENQRRLNERVQDLERKNEILQTTSHELRETVRDSFFSRLSVLNDSTRLPSMIAIIT